MRFGPISLAVLTVALGCTACDPAVDERPPASHSPPSQASVARSSGSNDAVTKALDGLEESMAKHDEDLAQVQAAADGLSARWHDARSAFERAKADYTRARTAYHDAKRRADRTAKEWGRVAREYERAEQLWKIYQELVMVAAALDAQNLDAARRGSQARLTSVANCDEGMSTARYRRLLERAGRTLVYMHIDHIVPQSLGGADHPDNYQVLPSSENQSLGNTWNEAKCRSVGAKCGRASAVSKACGSYGGPWC